MQSRFETFTVLINRISRNIRRIKNQEMAEFQLRGVHVSCLYYLYLFGNLTATELCEHCEEDKATISRALEYLEANGYLICRSKSPKRYKSPWSLTEKGRSVGQQIARKTDMVLSEVSAELSPEERTTFYHCLSIISNGLDAVARSGEHILPEPDTTKKDEAL